MHDTGHHSLFTERLEARTLLFGDVTARVVAGDVVIRGDDLDNVVFIDGEGLEPGALLISGDDDTRINGQFGSAFLEAVTGRIRIELKGGRDSIEVRNAALPGNFRIRGGASPHAIRIQNATVAGDLSIQTSRRESSGIFVEQDQIDLLGVDVEGKTTIHTGGGDDLVTADASAFAGKFALATGAGDDIFYLGDSAFDGGRRIKRGPGDDQFVRNPITFDTNFGGGAQGWSAGFSDFFTGRRGEHELASGIEPLPSELGEGTGFMISGKNITDDLFMYLSRRLEGNGLRPEQNYQVRFDMTFGSNGYRGCVGIGGAPGTSVFLKAGASRVRPANSTDDEQLQRLNLDKDNQGSGGRDLSFAGHVGVGRPDECVLDGPFKSKRVRHVHKFLVKTDDKGRVHAVIGTDSGFEGTTTIHWKRIRVQLIPVSPGAINIPGVGRVRTPLNG